jgi:hypothetical protein
MTGTELDVYIKRSAHAYRKLASEFGLMGTK